jgi:CPA2 family monovalent cation:H+ antiporter-2
VTIPDVVVAKSVVQNAKGLNPELHTVARASSPEHLPDFAELDVFEVVQPEYEAGLEMTRQALLHLRISPSDIQRYTDEVRQELYSSLDAARPDHRTLRLLQHADQHFDLEWVTLEPGCQLVGTSIAEGHIRSTTGASVVGVIRQQQLTPNPGPGFRLQENDLVAIIGSDDAREAFRKLAGLDRVS